MRPLQLLLVGGSVEARVTLLLPLIEAHAVGTRGHANDQGNNDILLDTEGLGLVDNGLLEDLIASLLVKADGRRGRLEVDGEVAALREVETELGEGNTGLAALASGVDADDVGICCSMD